MSAVNKKVVALAINAIAISAQSESDFIIKNHRTDLVDAPVRDRDEFCGKKGKKGKYLKDWE